MGIVCPVGFAPVKPAEFVIFRLAQYGERKLTTSFAAPSNARMKLDLHREQLSAILVISLTTLDNNAKGESL